MIAEEVEKVYPEMVVYGSDGQPETVKYQYLAPMLLNALQKEHAVVSSQQAIMTSQREVMRKQQHQIDELKARMEKLESLVLPKSNR